MTLLIIRFLVHVTSHGLYMKLISQVAVIMCNRSVMMCSRGIGKYVRDVIKYIHVRECQMKMETCTETSNIR